MRANRLEQLPRGRWYLTAAAARLTGLNPRELHALVTSGDLVTRQKRIGRAIVIEYMRPEVN